MSEPKFTPAPWYVQRGEDGEAIAISKLVTGDNGGATAKTIAQLPVPMTNRGHLNARTTRAEIDANAHLFAAAPELHASLVEISEMMWARPDMVKALHPLMGFAEKATFERASAALAKARGDQ